MATVGDTGDYINGLAFKESDWGNDGMPIIRIQNLTDSRKPFNRTLRAVDSNFVVNRGDILVSWSATLDAFLWDREASVLNQHIFKVIPNEQFVDKRFLFYLLRETIFEMKQSAHLHGSTMKHINRGPFLGFPAVIPPLNEQHRIVAEIETQLTRLDAAVTSLERTRANLKCYRAAVLKAACEGRLVPTEAELARAEGREYEDGSDYVRSLTNSRENLWHQGIEGHDGIKRPNSRQYPAIEVQEVPILLALPEGWDSTVVDRISIVVRGASPRPAGDPKFFGGAIPWITVGSLTADSQMHLTGVKEYVTEEGRKASRYIEAGTFLLTNSGATLGVPKITMIGGCINDGSVALTHLNDSIKPYLYYYLTTQTDRLRRINQGAAQPNLNTSIVKRIVVPVPPKFEQERIVAEVERRFSVLDEMEQTVSYGLRRAARLRQAILHQAFTGQLVPQDPDDEPASVLLDRIRAERTATSSGKPTRTLRKQAAGQLAMMETVNQ